MSSSNALMTMVIAFMIIHGVVLFAPATVQDLTGLNTSSIESATDYSTGSTNANVTTGPTVVDQAGAIVGYLTGNAFQNFWLAAFNFVTFIVTLIWLIEAVWIG